MLEHSNATANLAVKDLEKAKAFYEGTLGLKQVDDMDGELIVYKSGDTAINVYHSQFAGTNKATAITWAMNNACMRWRTSAIWAISRALNNGTRSPPLPLTLMASGPGSPDVRYRSIWSLASSAGPAGW